MPVQSGDSLISANIFQESLNIHTRFIRYSKKARLLLNLPYIAHPEPVCNRPWMRFSISTIGNMDSQLFLGGSEPSTLKDLAEALGKETIDSYNTSDTRGSSPSYGTSYQKLGKELLHLFVKSSVAQSENSRTGTRSTGFLSQIKAYQSWYSFRMEECDDRIK